MFSLAGRCVAGASHATHRAFRFVTWLVLVCLALTGSAQAADDPWQARWEIIDREENPYGFFSPIAKGRIVRWEVSPSFTGSPWMVTRVMRPRMLSGHNYMEVGLLYGKPRDNTALFIRKHFGERIIKGGWIYRVGRGPVNEPFWEFAPGQDISWALGE